MNNNDFLNELSEINWLSQAKNIKTIIETNDDWEWLPTTNTQQNPFSIEAEPTIKSNTFCLEAYKVTLSSLRKVGNSHPILIYGPHNYTKAFKGSALFCIRCFTLDFVCNRASKWSEIYQLYKHGFWPCGIDCNNQIIIL